MSDNLKDIFKQHVDNHESAVDPNEIWEGIVKKRQEPKKRRILFFIPFAFLLLTTAFLLISEFQFSEKQLVQVSESSSVENILTKQNADARKDGEIKSDIIQEQTPVLTTKELIPTNSPAFVSTENHSLNSIPNTVRKTTNTLFTPNASTYNSTIKNPTTVLKKSTISASTDPIIRSTLSHIPILSLLSPSLFLDDKPQEINDNIIPLKKRKRRPSISIEFAGATLSKSLNSVDPILLPLTDEKQAYEKPIDSYSARILFNLPVYNNFSIDLGVAYTRMYEKFDWSGTYMRNEFGDILPIDSYDSEGTPLFNYTTGNYFEEINNRISYFNQYEAIDIPVSLSYDLNVFRKVDLRMSAGYNLSLVERFKGYLFTEQNVPTRLENLKDYPTFSSAPFVKMNLSYPIFQNAMINCGIEVQSRKMTERTTTWNYRSLGAFLGLSVGI